MKLPFLRKSAEREPLIVSMTGARLGERILYRGESIAHVIALAARSGLSGRTVVLAPAGETTGIEQAVASHGVLVEASAIVPPDSEGGFDLGVLDVSRSDPSARDWTEVLKMLTAALRHGGRLIAVEPGKPRGLRARLSGEDGTPPRDLLQQMQAVGLARARMVGERDGLRFLEAVKSNV